MSLRMSGLHVHDSSPRAALAVTRSSEADRAAIRATGEPSLRVNKFLLLEDGPDVPPEVDDVHVVHDRSHAGPTLSVRERIHLESVERVFLHVLRHALRQEAAAPVRLARRDEVAVRD